MASTAAPGRLEKVREFINTTEIEAGRDPLNGPDDLESWCSKQACAIDSAAEASTLRAFRESLRAVLEAADEDGRAAAWQAVEPFAARAGYGMRISPDGAPALVPQGTGYAALISEIFAIAYDAVRDGTWQRLKACRKHNCRWAFYDRSKNGSGAWCSMAVCGNRMKAQKRRLSRKNAPGK